MNKRIISVLLTIILTISLATPAVAQEVYRDDLAYTQARAMFEANIAQEFGVEFAHNYVRAREVADRLIGSFPVDRVGNFIFPADFGGAFIDSNGKLNLLVVGTGADNFSGSNSFFTINQRDDSLIVGEARFSYNELREVMKTLNDLIPRKFESVLAVGNVTSLYVDVINNRVVVNLVDFSDEMIELFRNSVFDSPVLSFGQSERMGEMPIPHEELYASDEPAAYFSEDMESRNTVWISPGSPDRPITVRRNGQPISGSFAIGYLASMGTTRGFVTVAHGPWREGFHLQTNDSIYQSGARIGTVTSFQLNGIDAAFVRTDFHVMFDVNTPDGRRTVGLRHNLLVGNTVMMTSTLGTRSGQITSLDYIEIFTNRFGGAFSANRLIATNYPSTLGDSGGIVYFPQFNPRGFLESGVVGIHIGRSQTGRGLVSTTTEINRILGLTTLL
ncbi:MAG: S1 family peptidase [Defluviitaleaceae bacterium]|nr:S1 family peptidase [Defluviitaleaceae bacterium]